VSSRLGGSMSSTIPIAVFQSDFFELPFSEGVNVTLGRDLAEYLKKKFEDIGTQISGPFEDETHWELYTALQDDRFGIAVHWAPIGEPPRDFWVIHPR